MFDFVDMLCALAIGMLLALLFAPTKDRKNNQLLLLGLILAFVALVLFRMLTGLRG